MKFKNKSGVIVEARNNYEANILMSNKDYTPINEKAQSKVKIVQNIEEKHNEITEIVQNLEKSIENMDKSLEKKEVKASKKKDGE